MSKKPGGNPGGERRQLTEAERSDGRYDELQARVNAAYEAMRAANLNYFRLNIWGMAVCGSIDQGPAGTSSETYDEIVNRLTA